MNTFVEDFASKLDDAKALALKMSINQEVEVLKYVFLFVEQLQKDLIDKLTIKGSLVTFSFIPQMGISNCTQDVFVTPDANNACVRQRILEHYNGRILPPAKEEEDGTEKCDGFRQTCDELDEHYFRQFPQSRSDTDMISGVLDSGMQGKLDLPESSSKALHGAFSSGDSSVSLICLAGPKSRTVSMHCKRTLAAKVRASLNRSKAGAEDTSHAVSNVASVVNSSSKSKYEEMNNDSLNSNLNNGLENSACSSGSGFEATPAKKSRPSSGRRCRRERVDGKYTCSFPGCFEKYSNLEHVADHELQHTVPGGHFWPCSQCPQRFKWRHYLRLHLKLQHRCTEVAPVEMPVS